MPSGTEAFFGNGNSFKNGKSYNIQYAWPGNISSPSFAFDLKAGRVAHGRPAAADPKICPGWRSAYLELGLTIHPVDGLCFQGPNTLDGKKGHISQTL